MGCMAEAGMQGIGDGIGSAVYRGVLSESEGGIGIPCAWKSGAGQRGIRKSHRA